MWLLALVAIGVIILLAQPKSVTGYVGGAPVVLNVVNVGNGASLEVKAATAFLLMRTACLAEGGGLISPSGPRAGFRTSEEQAELVRTLGLFSQGGLAAEVNRSPHQSGIALDLNGCDMTNEAAYKPTTHAWLVSNCHRFSWLNTGDGFSGKKEPWHYEYHPEVLA